MKSIINYTYILTETMAAITCHAIILSDELMAARPNITLVLENCLLSLFINSFEAGIANAISSFK